MPQNTKPKQFSGIVIQGEAVGRTIGFPTANLDTIPSEKDLRPGVYLGYCRLNQKLKTRKTKQISKNKLEKRNKFSVSNLEFSALPCLVYFGPRYIFGETQNVFEVYLIDFTGDLYGKKLTVQLTHFIRPPKKLSSLDELKTQLAEDKKRAERLLKS